ncbi:hypothetical protein MFLAVUS_001490 [Mucor flavus]|uniref:BHLH domain-containing protein n=1 Tax=Mucor flavus TaxID=439312 RepID=A0ABP9YML7_9FUNG
MYNRNRRPSFRDITPSTTVDNGDLFSIFNKFPAGSSLASASVNETHIHVPSIPTSANSSYVSDKEHAKQVYGEDSESSDNSNSKRRMSLNKAERRAEHNAIERARRECLNSKFLQLAEALPNLQNHRRPSKGQIVEKALDWVKQNMSKEDRYQYQIMQLQNENRRLMTQINIAQEQSTNIMVTSPNSSSPAATRRPVPQQQHAFSKNSTKAPPSTCDGDRLNSTNPSRYYNQIDEMSMMGPMAPFGVEWRHTPVFANQNSTEYVIPSASSSSSSRLLPEDDDESSLSNEDFQNYHIQMSYNDMSQCSPFEMSHPLSSGTNIPWSKNQIHPQYAIDYSSTGNAIFDPYTS